MVKTTFPKMQNKYRLKPFFRPEEMLEDISVNEYRSKKAIFVYSSNSLNDRLVNELDLKKVDKFIYGSKEHYISKKYDTSMVFLSIGAPITAIATEMLISLGVKEFLIFGASGGINEKLALGDVVLCTKAIRDEGTSHHYIKNSFFSYPDDELTSRLKKILKKSNIPFFSGPIWTIDALFMETRKEINHYKKMGILSVDMETSTLFAVAKKRKVKAGAILFISDLLQEEKGLKPNELKFVTMYENLAKVAKCFSENLFSKNQ